MNPESPTVLVLIAGDHLRHMTGQVLAARGYRVRLSATTAAAVEVLERQPISCILLDAAVSTMALPELLATLHRRQPNLPIVLVEGERDIQSVAAAMAVGAYEYLPRPLEPCALLAAIARAIGPLPLISESSLPSSAATPPPQESEPDQLATAAAALGWLVRAMEAKDPHFPGHSLRVAELAASIASALGRPDWEIEEIRMAGQLHDIGMIAIADGVLTKAGTLTPEERAEVRRHPLLGAQLVAAYPGMNRIAAIVRGHHERWDGAGYPDGLTGDAIPWGARVLAAAEIFDALTSQRAYRPASSVTATLDRMCELSADAIDPAILRGLQRVVSRRETLSFIREDDDVSREGELLVRPGAPVRPAPRMLEVAQ